MPQKAVLKLKEKTQKLPFLETQKLQFPVDVGFTIYMMIQVPIYKGKDEKAQLHKHSEIDLSSTVKGVNISQ